MRVDYSWPTPRLHLDPTQARLVLDAELGLGMGNDAAVYLSAALQHTIELLVSGALACSGTTKFRSETVTRVDMQPRHLQYYIRTDEEMWILFNAAFAFQVILSVFLDHATELCFRRLGLPIHSREALSACDYYSTVVDSLREKQTAQSCKTRDLWSLVTPAQLCRVAAGVNPLCSISPKACLMTDALAHEVFMALCEGVVRIRPDTRVITIVDLEGGIRDLFPERLASELTHVAQDAVARLVDHIVEPSKTNAPEEGVDMVRLCVRRLQGARTLLRKTFKVAPRSLLFAVFSKACDRLHIREGSVVFVQDGIILSGRLEAGTLMLGAGTRSVQIFAVCKKAWASKQREAARRGHLMASDNNTWDPLETTRRSSFHNNSQTHSSTLRGQSSSKLLQITSVPIIRKPPQHQQQKQQQANKTSAIARSGHEAPHSRTGVRCSITSFPQSRALPLLPPGLGGAGGGQRLLANPGPTPRRKRRWIETPVDGRKLDLAKLEKARPLPPRPTCVYETRLPGSVSTGTLDDTMRGGDGIGGRLEGGLSPRFERTQRRLKDMEACLRDLDDSVNELRSGGPGGRQSGIPTVALAVITSQLDVAFTLSSLCRQVLSTVHKEGGKAAVPDDQNSRQGRDQLRLSVADLSISISSRKNKASESKGGSDQQQEDVLPKSHPVDAPPEDSSRLHTEVPPPPNEIISEGQGGMLGASRLPGQCYDQPEFEMSAATISHDGAQSSLEKGGVRQQSQLIEDLQMPGAESERRGEEVQQPTSGNVGYAFYKRRHSFDGRKSQGSFPDSDGHEDAGRRAGLISHDGADDEPNSKEHAPPTQPSVYTSEGDNTAVSDSPVPDTSLRRQELGHDELFADGVGSVHARGRAALLASTLEAEVVVAADSIREEGVLHAPRTPTAASATTVVTTKRRVAINDAEARSTLYQPGVEAHPSVEGAGKGTARLIAADGSVLLESVAAGTSTIDSGVVRGVDCGDTGDINHAKGGPSVGLTGYQTSKDDGRLDTHREDEDWDNLDDDDDDLADDGDGDQAGGNWSSWLTA